VTTTSPAAEPAIPPDEIQARALRCTGLRQQDDDGRQADHDDWQVYQKHPAPPVVREQPTTQDRAGWEGHEVDPSPDGDGLRSLLLGEERP